MAGGSDGLTIRPVLGVPEVQAGDDLASLLVTAAGGGGLVIGDVLVVSSKVVSKALGLTAAGDDKSTLVLDESVRVVAERAVGDGRVTRIVEAVAGPVMAAAGIDASNVGPSGSLLLLPHDPDACARDLRASLLELLGMPSTAPFAVILSDTAGRPWRAGLTDFALGSAGLVGLLDHRGEADADGRVMSVTARAVADEVAAAADLVKGKSDGVAAAVVRGLPQAWFRPGGEPDRNDSSSPGARELVRTGPGDWFALGPVEALRAALGVAPGSADSELVGITSVGGEPFAVRVARVVALTLFADEEASVDLDLGGEVVDDSLGDTAGHAAARVAGEAAASGERGGSSDISERVSDVTGAPRASVTLGATDDFMLGRLTQRLQIAAASEGLVAQLAGEPTAEHAITAHLLPVGEQTR